MTKKYKAENRYTIRLDDEVDRLLSTFATQRKITRSEAIREAIKQAANDTSMQRVADHLEQIVRRVSDLPLIARNIEAVSNQVIDMASINSTNTDRIVCVLKALHERIK